MAELFSVADEGEIMPPKTTWFLPKLAAGLVVRLIEIDQSTGLLMLSEITAGNQRQIKDKLFHR
jgi:hypothetical protein